MTTPDTSLTATDLDKALDRLVPPVPSDVLRRRVLEMVPGRRNASTRIPVLRIAAAAVLALAVGVATLLQTGLPSENRLVDETVQVTAPAAAEISAQEIALIDGPAQPTVIERFSVAGLPLE